MPLQAYNHFPSDHLFLHRPSKLSAAGCPLMARLADSPVVLCLSYLLYPSPWDQTWAAIHIWMALDIETWTVSQQRGSNGLNRGVFSCKIYCISFFFLMAHTVTCLEVSLQHYYYSWLMWDQWKKRVGSLKKRWTSVVISILYLSKTLYAFCCDLYTVSDLISFDC